MPEADLLTDQIAPALRPLADRLGAEQDRHPLYALVDHVADLARAHRDATGCAFTDACQVVIDLLIDEASR